MRGIASQVERGRAVVVELTTKTKRRLSQRYIDYAQTFGTEQGKRVLADLCKTSGVYDSAFADGEALSMAYRAGARDMALQCINMSGQGKFDVSKRIRELDQNE